METNNLNTTDTQAPDSAVKVCLCRAVNMKTIKDAIRNGASDFEKVKELTGAGTGACKGHRCSETIKNLIADYKAGKWE